jgi:hypothetical protein
MLAADGQQLGIDEPIEHHRRRIQRLLVRDAPPPTLPGAAQSAAALARELDAEALVWLSRNADGAALWIYDASKDTVVARPIPDPPLEARRSDLRSDLRSDDEPGERAPTYPPAPAVLDLDSLAAEIDGNSERPPPIRRIGVAEPKIHLKPARVPTQLFDTLVSPVGEVDPERKG